MTTRNHRAFSDADAEDMIGLVKMGYTQREVAQAYEISVSTVYKLVSRRRYQEMTLQEDRDNFSVAVTGSKSLGIL